MTTFDARPSAFTQLSTTAEWEAIHSAMGCRDGVDLSNANGLTPSLDTPGRNAVMASGAAVIRGQLWYCDAPVSTAIPAASAQNRIDRLVLRLTRGATTSPTVVQPAVITGTPSGSPVAPNLTRTPTGIWELPISRWTSTSAGGLTGLVDDRQFALDSWHDMRPLANAFVGTIAGELPPQYRLDTANGIVFVAGCVQLPPSGSYNGVPFMSLPTLSPCIPVIGSGWAVSPLGGAPNANTAAGFPRCYVASGTGDITFSGFQASTNGTNVRINGQYPINANGLITS
jgi:hypothetical protein